MLLYILYIIIYFIFIISSFPFSFTFLPSLHKQGQPEKSWEDLLYTGRFEQIIEPGFLLSNKRVLNVKRRIVFQLN
jgi:hypothetical protein